MPQVDIAVPEWMLKADENDQRRVRTMEKPIPLTSVRLVFPLPDPTTGVMRDVIVKKLINGPIFHDRYTGRKRWSRIIPGLDVVVPWPKVEPKVHTDYDCDTLRIDVESITFVPSLLKPPMPPTVIDELRNKFSIFRTRHEESYIAEKIREEQEAQAKKKLAEEMRTPLKEVNRRERKLRKASGKGKLTRDMLVRIGEVVEKKRLTVAEASGLQKEAVAV
jgi:large subunit ribosomal protein L24